MMIEPLHAQMPAPDKPGGRPPIAMPKPDKPGPKNPPPPTTKK
jgi:hypothetical protein